MGNWAKIIFTLGEVHASYLQGSSRGEDVMLPSGIFAFRFYRRSELIIDFDLTLLADDPASPILSNFPLFDDRITGQAI